MDTKNSIFERNEFMQCIDYTPHTLLLTKEQ